MNVSCMHDRVVRLVVSDTDLWICNQCNAQFVARSAINWKLRALSDEVLRLTRLERICHKLVESLADVQFEYPPAVLLEYTLWKASNEQAARMRAEESIPIQKGG